MQKTFQAALNTTDTFPVVEHMIYHVHQRVAEKFYEGRVVLLGDAVHVNSTLGGLGLNSGVHDATDLSHRMLRIFEANGQNIEAEFATYAEARHAVALKYVRSISEKNTQVMTEKKRRGAPATTTRNGRNSSGSRKGLPVAVKLVPPVERAGSGDWQSPAGLLTYLGKPQGGRSVKLALFDDYRPGAVNEDRVYDISSLTKWDFQRPQESLITLMQTYTEGKKSIIESLHQCPARGSSRPMRWGIQTISTSACG